MRPAHPIDDNAHQQDQANGFSSDDEPGEVETADEQKQKDKCNDQEIHGCKIDLRDRCRYGAFTRREPSLDPV